MKFFVQKLIGLFGLALILTSCAPKESEVSDIPRSQREREIFLQPYVTTEELDALRRMPDDRPNNIYFRDFAMLRGITTGDNRHFYVLQFIVGYNFRNRQLGVDLLSRRLVIQDRVRALLSTLQIEDFSASNTENLRRAIKETVDAVLWPNQSNDIIILRLETYAAPN
jgi:flagellar basal body-associated protein FliL